MPIQRPTRRVAASSSPLPQAAIPAPPTTVVEPVEPAAEATPAQPAQRYRAAKFALHHPYQNVRVPTTGSVLMVEDSWVQVQLAAKVIIRV